MEGQQQSNNNNNNNNELDGGSSNNNTKAGAGAGGLSSFMCRQSSTRWTPTSEQIRILKDLYYNNGIRSPSADQIQRISARLRQYGKIEGKNVFYWFQNHKARERQKKRFTTVTTSTNAAPPQYDHLHHNIINPPFERHHHHNNNNNNALNPALWRSSDQADHPPINLYNNNYPPPNGVVPCPSSSPGVFATVGQMGSYGYGSVAMEQSFRDCSISPKDHNSTGGSLGQNISVPCAYPFLGKINSVDDHETLEEEDEDEDDNQTCREIETLPLFPMHGEEYSSGFSCNNNNNKPESSNGHYYTSGWYQSDINGSARASLELSLNSYITGSRSTDQFY